MKSKMKMRIAGTMEANINHTGRGFDKPIGLISQPRLSAAVGDTPSGTSSLYKPTHTRFK